MWFNCQVNGGYLKAFCDILSYLFNGFAVKYSCIRMRVSSRLWIDLTQFMMENVSCNSLVRLQLWWNDMTTTSNKPVNVCSDVHRVLVCWCQKLQSWWGLCESGIRWTDQFEEIPIQNLWHWERAVVSLHSFLFKAGHASASVDCQMVDNFMCITWLQESMMLMWRWSRDVAAFVFKRLL